MKVFFLLHYERWIMLYPSLGYYLKKNKTLLKLIKIENSNCGLIKIKIFKNTLFGVNTKICL